MVAAASRPDPAISTACPVCGETACTSLGTKHSCELFECRGCKTVHIGDSEQRFDYGLYYGDGIHVASAAVQRTLERMLDRFEPMRRTGRMLDIGFGAADLPQAALRRGWQVHGTEFSERACTYGRGLGINVFQGELAQAGYPDEYFDVVCAVELLEHVEDPAQVTREVARVLRPGGVFWATTPHGRGLSRRLLGKDWTIVTPPEHRQLFSRRGAKRLLKDCGFGSVELRTHSLNPYEILAHFRKGKDAAPFNRGKSSASLNEALGSSRLRLAVKDAMNWALNVTRLGDSLKIFAVRR